MAIPMEELDTKPWYRQFWPWFLIFFPATAVVAGIITVIIAVQTDDGLVKDDYYKEGLAINKSLTLIEKAGEFGIASEIHVDQNLLLYITLTHNNKVSSPSALMVTLTHPTLPEHDIELTLLPSGKSGVYIGKLEPAPPSNWHLHITDPDKTWLTQQRIRF